MTRATYAVRRRETRIYVNFPVTMRIGWEGCRVTRDSTIDFSESGMRVRVDVPFRLGQDVKLEGHDNGALAKKHRVVWVRGDSQTGQPKYEAGLELRA